MRKLLHISDVHFGPPHRPERSAAVLDLVAERRPDLVVISGDLTQRAKPGQFAEARRWADRIPAPWIAVPGNHDVPLYRFWERFGRPYGAYRKHFSDDLEPVWEDDELLVVGVNTAHGLTFTNGRIRPRRLRRLEARLAAAPPGAWRVVVAHHNLIPPPRFDDRRVMARSRRAAESFARAGADLVLSGHRHQTYLGTTEEFFPSGGRPVLLVHAGTTTSDRGRGLEKGRNTCNWIELDADAATVSCLRWEEPSGRFEEASRHRYPRFRGEDSPARTPAGEAP